MNMRIETPAVFSPAPAGPGAGASLVQASVVALSASVAALVFETERSGIGRLGGEIGGLPLPRPFLTTRLALRRGGFRHVLVVGRSAEALAGTPCALTLGGWPAAAVDPGWLQSPLADVSALVDGLAEDGRRRLLRMLTTTGASLFGAGQAAGFGAAVARILRMLSVPEAAASSVCAVGAAGRLASFRLAGGCEGVEALTALSEDRVVRVAGFETLVEAGPKGTVLHVLLPEGPVSGALLALGTAPMVLSLPEGAPRPLGPWLARRPTAVREWVEASLGGMADGVAAAQLRELRFVDAPGPVARVTHLSATAAGMLVLAEIEDPHGLIASLRVECGEAVRDLAVAPRQGAAGGFVGIAGGAGVCRVRMVYGSGRVQTVCERAPEAFDGAIPAGFERLGVGHAAKAIAVARLTRGARAVAAVEEVVGVVPRRPRLSVVAGIGADPDVIRARAAMIAAEPEAGSVELICHARAAQAGAAARVLAECAAVFGLGCRLLVLPEDADGAERLRAALGAARAPALAMGAEVLPAAPGWLAEWITALEEPGGPAMIGGTVLSSDGAVIDAGREVKAGRVARRWLGLPAATLPEDDTAPTDAAGADCVGLKRRALTALRGMDLHYPEADVLMLGLGARLGGRRKRMRTLLKGRFIRFGEAPAAGPLDAAVEGEAVAAILRGAAKREARR